MLSKKYRLTKREDFYSVYKKGFCIEEDALLIKYLKSEQPLSRIGFSVSKHFSKKAVSRNRTKRVLQEVCRFYLPSLKNGFDIVITPRPNQERIEFNKTKDILNNIFIKANLFK
ncbi:MAG TPA: ribonuclease P protein component [Candidatus Moranbacteria bacterium]|nr:ribonuclease P protein component [Candidatus Moranbacteria bacterium]HRZ33603.1 ribonuclease P protein component [Candidatus Moranbacteria bacterium]